MGLLPDRDLMSTWTLDARAFIGELVKMAFDVELGDVMLADAIRHEKLRGLLSEAERQLNAGDSRAAFKYADGALYEARQLWLVQQDYARRAPLPHEPVAGDAVDLLEVQAFTSDIAGYTRLLTTRRHVETGGPEPDVAEARSTLLFAFDWILRWEVFKEGYPIERYVEFWDTLRSPQLDDGGPPRLVRHIESYRLEVGAGREEEFEVLLQLANLPVKDDRDWGRDFPAALEIAEQELDRSPPVGFHGIDPDGLLRVRVPVSVDPAQLLSLLSRAIDLATQSHQRRDQDMREWRLHALELRNGYEAVLRDTTTSSNVFGEVNVIPELSSNGVRYIVSLSLPEATLSELNTAASIFSGQGRCLAASTHQSGNVVFEATPLEDDALDRLRKAIHGTEEEIVRYRDIVTKHEQQRQSFTKQVESLLGVVPTGTGRKPSAGEDETD
jgi:hypothetical protein